MVGQPCAAAFTASGGSARPAQYSPERHQNSGAMAAGELRRPRLGGAGIDRKMTLLPIR